MKSVQILNTNKQNQNVHLVKEIFIDTANKLNYFVTFSYDRNMVIKQSL